MDEQYAIEKFTRCPKCRSFSLKGVRPHGEDRGSETSVCKIYACSNCGDKYVLHGNTLKKKSNLLHSKKPEPVKQESVKQEPVKQEPPKQEKITEPVKMKNKNTSRTAVILVSFFCLAVLGFIFLLYPGSKKQERSEVSQPLMEKNHAAEDAEEDGTVEVNTENTEPNGGDDADPEPENLPGDNALTAEENTPPEETPAPEQVTANNNHSQPSEPVSYKVFDFSGIKVRKSSPDHSDKSLRWFFNKKTITITRSKNQRVYIAGDPTGKSKWAVDDEITINGRPIKGFSEELSVTGYIPESKQVQPFDITHLVPSDSEIVLDIRLVDYGIFWGNTPVYVVVI
jgi:hypothetical protein